MTAALGFGAAIAASGVLLSTAVSLAHRERLLARAFVRAERTRVGQVTFSRSLGIGVAVLGLAVAGERLAGPVGAIVGAASVPGAIGAMRRRRTAARAAEAERQLHEAILAMAAAVRAGMSIRLAVAEARRDAEEPLAAELDRASRGLEVGQPLDEVLQQLGDRIGIADARLVAGALRVHRRTGGDLPALLDEVGEVVRQRSGDRRQAAALTAQARASGAVLAALPVVFVALLSGAGGGGLADFYRTSLGVLLLLAAGCCQGLGFLWMRRIVRAAETA